MAPAGKENGLHEAITDLRARGEVVVEALPGHEGTWSETGCDRQLVLRAGKWTIEGIQGEV